MSWQKNIQVSQLSNKSGDLGERGGERNSPGKRGEERNSPADKDCGTEKLFVLSFRNLQEGWIYWLQQSTLKLYRDLQTKYTKEEFTQLYERPQLDELLKRYSKSSISFNTRQTKV